MGLDSWHSMHFPDEPFEYDRSQSADWVPADVIDIPTASKHPATIGTRLFLTPLDSEYLEQFGLEAERLLSLLDNKE